jgi:O-methyltransferase involved in polyketide biosynthesis
MTKDYSKISPTAVMVSALRAKYTDLPYSKELYRAVKLITKPRLFAGMGPILSRLTRFAPHSMVKLASLESRYLSVNGVLQELDDSYAVVEIACGLSARGLEWIGSNKLYIETDLPDMLSIKQQVFGNILIEKGISQAINHHFFPLNALDYDDWDRLGQKFFNAKKSNIAIIHEGLAGYLSIEEKQKLMDNIKRFFHKYSIAGIWITPDFYPYDGDRGTWILKLWKKGLERKTQTKIHYFANNHELLDFLLHGGFQASLRSSSFVLDQVTCISKVPLDKEEVRQALDRYQVCIARYTA